jgi:hypothetical protein
VIRSYPSTFSKNWSNTLTQRYSLKFYTPSKKINYNISRYIIESRLSKAGIPLASNLGEFIQNNIKWLEAKLSKDCSRDPVAGPSGLVGSEESDLGFPLHPECAIQTYADWYFLHGIFG